MRYRFLLVAIAAALSACSVDATVTVRMRENGSGAVSVRVVLDAAAVRAAEVGGGTLEERVRLEDLPDAGWTVSPWRRRENGGATIMVRKPFARPEQVADVVAEVSGGDGPFRDFHASRENSTFSTRWRVDGDVDLRTPRLGIGADQQLVERLTAARVDPALVEADLVSGLDGLRIHAVAELPGGAQRTVTAAAGERAGLVATSTSTDLGRVALLVVGCGGGLLALVILVVGERRARRDRTRRAAA